MTGLLIGALLAVAAGGAGVAIGRAWGRTVERAAQAEYALARMGEANRARHQQVMAVGQAVVPGADVVAGGDLPPRGDGLADTTAVQPAVDTRDDARLLLADFTRGPLDTMATHGRARDVPPPPPLDPADACEVYPEESEPEPDPEIPDAGDEPDPPEGQMAVHRYQWPAFTPQRPATPRGVMPRGWMTAFRRLTRRPKVDIRRVGQAARDTVQGWAPGEATTLIAGASALALSMPTERVVRGKGMHTRRRVRQEQRQRRGEAGRHRQAAAPSAPRQRRQLNPDWRAVLRPPARTVVPTMPSMACTP